MKKILLASTALVLSAGLASAQGLSISGQGRMGVQYNSTLATTTRQENRLQLNFNVSVAADHGMSFGAYSRVRINNGATGIFSGSRVWGEISGFRITVGNQDGAVRGAGVAFGYAGGCGVGYEGGQQCGDSMGLLGVTQGFASTGGGFTIATARTRIDYTMGDTRIALSRVGGGATEIGARTSFNAWTVAAGYSNTGTGVTTVSAGYNGGSWAAGLGLARIAGATNYVLQGSTNMGGGSVYGYIGRVAGSATYGLNYGYGLGGGATLTVGAERNTAGAGTTTASVGVAFNF